MKTGMLVGKFAPLHNGHINFINRASTMCDKLLVILVFDQKWLNEQTPFMQSKLTFKNRLRWLKEVYSDFDHIIIDWIDETDIQPEPNGWQDFINKCKNVHEKHFGFTDPYEVYSSEIRYNDGFSKYLPDTKHVLIDPDRNRINISATKVRDDLFNNWEYLPSTVRKDFVYKVCIIGTESTGKTTLVKYLAKMFNTSWVEEYGRTIVENELFRDETLLKYEDYRKIVYRHKELEEHAARTANKLMFVDTDAVVTAFYQQLYEGNVDNVVDTFARERDYDLTIFLDNDVKWVHDGMRMHGNDDQREKTQNLLLKLIKDYDVKNLRMISGNYTKRLDDSYELIMSEMSKQR